MIKYLIYLVIAAAAIASILWTWDHYITQPAVQRGRAEFAPVMQSCEANLSVKTPAACGKVIASTVDTVKSMRQTNADLAAKINDLQVQYAALQSTTDDAQRRAAAALAQAKKNQAVMADDIKRMAAIMAAPRSTEPSEVINARANDILRGIVTSGGVR